MNECLSFGDGLMRQWSFFIYRRSDIQGRCVHVGIRPHATCSGVDQGRLSLVRRWSRWRAGRASAAAPPGSTHERFL